MEKSFEKLVKESKHILIISHINPDGDTLGSMCAVYSAILSKFKIKADMLIPSQYPQIYNFIPEIKNAKMINDYDKSREYDLIITVDVAALDRIGDAQILFNKAKHTVNFDHHQTNIGFAEINFIEPHACSTGEVIFKIFSKLGWTINLNTAEALYAAILTDTGGFRFENTTSETLNIASKLVEIGVLPRKIYDKCYNSKSKSEVLFQSYIIEQAIFSDNNEIAYATVTKKDMEKFNVKDSATDGIAETLRSIITTQVSFVVKEIDQKICKISMRSKKLDVSKICMAFGGGGHKFASGCTIKGTVQEATKKLLQEINKQKND